jgi:AraC family transcriptional regulator of arabinose operon
LARRHPDRAAAQQPDPLLPGYPFTLYLVAGTTAIAAGGPLDFAIDRPGGMDGWIVNLTVQGHGRVRDGRERFDCGAGELLLFPPGVPHDYARAPDSPDWHHRWVYFRPRGFWARWLRWPLANGQRVGRLRLEAPEVRAEIDALFAAIEAAHRGGRAASEDLAINLLERLLIRCHEETPGYRPRVPDPRVHAACQFICAHLARSLSLDEIARHVCLSPSRLVHLFRDQMGVNILRWREDQRILLAKHLLVSGTTPVSTLAGMVGYDDQLYFSRVFRKCVGVSPTEFRRGGGGGGGERRPAPDTDGAPTPAVSWMRGGHG